VLVLLACVQGGMLSSVQQGGGMPAALSYARLQGHDELVRHFASTATLANSEVSKRPIFKESVAQSQQAREPARMPSPATLPPAGLLEPAYIALPEKHDVVVSVSESTGSDSSAPGKHNVAGSSESSDSDRVAGPEMGA